LCAIRFCLLNTCGEIHHTCVSPLQNFSTYNDPCETLEDVLFIDQPAILATSSKTRVFPGTWRIVDSSVKHPFALYLSPYWHPRHRNYAVPEISTAEANPPWRTRTMLQHRPRWSRWNQRIPSHALTLEREGEKKGKIEEEIRGEVAFARDTRQRS